MIVIFIRFEDVGDGNIQCKMDSAQDAHLNGKGRVCTNHRKGRFFHWDIKCDNYTQRTKKHQVLCSPDLTLKETLWYDSLSSGKLVVYEN